MITPGFTAEASLRTSGGHFRQTSSVPAATAERYGLAQLGQPVPPNLQQPLQRIEILPRYGNWCGFGNKGEPPIDAVDRVCCRHDKCYCARGELDCSCGRDLITGMAAAIADPDTPAAGRVYGALAMAFFERTPCLCHRWCRPALGWPPYRCGQAPFPVPVPVGKICPPPYY